MFDVFIRDPEIYFKNNREKMSKIALFLINSSFKPEKTNSRTFRGEIKPMPDSDIATNIKVVGQYSYKKISQQLRMSFTNDIST